MAKKTGRKGKYHDWLTNEGLLTLEGWARDGLIDEQIAHNIGISRSTLNDWKLKYPDISDALKRGKEVVDRQVENALLKNALGFQYDEVTRENVWDEDKQVHRMTVTKVVTKEVKPDTTAQIFWLKNRKPNEWRDKRDIEHSGTVQNNVDLSALSVEELRNLANIDD
ncbi:transposase [Sporosarcina sp. NCCP-2716]|uniref:DNA-packaging protein n=1 Tax=Sporosarcina sp. NCCP-2716 TaxID=2943679 RepID=UPI00203E7243|nr:DNA-packaging protein [Sporosarcina sp. NCCP-2716]GKV70268.1 transposase [Sporosarcina sp. NCCP-2716]